MKKPLIFIVVGVIAILGISYWLVGRSANPEKSEVTNGSSTSPVATAVPTAPESQAEVQGDVDTVATLKDVKRNSDGSYSVVLDYISRVPCTADNKVRHNEQNCSGQYLMSAGANPIYENLNMRTRTFPVSAATKISLQVQSADGPRGQQVSVQELFEATHSAVRPEHYYGIGFTSRAQLEKDNKNVIGYGEPGVAELLKLDNDVYGDTYGLPFHVRVEDGQLIELAQMYMA